MVAIAPLGLMTAVILIGYAFGMSFMDYIELCKYSGLAQWDIIAVVASMQSGYLTLPFFLYCLNGSAKKLENFASNFNHRFTQKSKQN